MTGFFSKRKIFIYIGSSFIALGILVNEWILAKVLSPDGSLEISTRNMIWFFDIFIILIGLLTIRQRKKTLLISRGVVTLRLFIFVTIIALIGSHLAPRIIGYGSDQAGATLQNNFDDGSIVRRLSVPATPPELVSLENTYDTQPSFATDATGVPWIVWVGYAAQKGGDQIYVARQEKSEWMTPEVVTPEVGNYVRPVIVSLGKGMAVLWTATGDETSIWMSRFFEGVWSIPTRIIFPGHHLNPEVCLDRQGQLWMVWQSYVGTGYNIFLASYNGSQWSEPVSITQHPGNEWDPSIVSDSKGKLWIVWSAFRDADYDLYLVSYEAGELSEERRLTDHQAYDLHPSLAVDGQDCLWIAWDRVSVPRHGSSGHVVSKEGKLVNIGVGWQARSALNKRWESETTVELLCLKDSALFSPPKGRWIKGHYLMHCAYPKVAVDRAGNVWLALRAWTFKVTNPNTYWWDVVVARYSADGWSTPEILSRSDGYLEEPSLFIDENAIWVAAQMEHRVTANAGHPHPEYGSETFQFGHHWPWMPQGSKGDIYVTRYETATGKNELALQEVPRLSGQPSALSKRWISRDSIRYEIDYQGVTYKLLFGDTHKHSNISRCSAGSEPSLDDHYRYAQDVCQYDFLVMSDHSNHTNDFNWWTIQKSADLYYVPGSFVTLFGYELSNGYPIGHKNIVFQERPAPILRIRLDQVSTGPEIWQNLKGIKAITIPHTSASGTGTDWREHDPEFERLVEIFQSHRGSSEHEGAPRVHGSSRNKLGFVHRALAKGYKMGFIASTDHGFGAAYAVVYAKSATREDVFEALYSRRCYASTSRGIVLDFRANGHLMGEEIEADSGAEFSITVRAQAPIERVDLFADQVVVQKWDFSDPGKRRCSLSWTDPTPGQDTRTYYVRVMLQDKEMCWSSPIWVNYGVRQPELTKKSALD